MIQSEPVCTCIEKCGVMASRIPEKHSLVDISAAPQGSYMFFKKTGLPKSLSFNFHVTNW